ncbi:MAG: response regulator transcription factor [Bacteroidetes bacterium]|nr:response regulator transcription factor [Bacteroidota bacterium]MCL5738397.1 response regulator transcription factor [Bacteroidota bacterium]
MKLRLKISSDSKERVAVTPQTSDENIIRVTIVEDDDEIRNGLCWLLNHSEGFTCEETCRSCSEVLRGIEDNTPDVILMDIGLPGKSGIDCVQTIKEHYPRVEILMFTVYSDDEKVFQSIRNGAVGYILKNTSPEKLLEAIKEAYKGGAPMSAEIARKVIRYFQGEDGSDLTASLSQRETEVLQCLIDGYSYRVIAEKLFISVHTVRFHLHNIYEKLHVRSRAELVAKTVKKKHI